MEEKEDIWEILACVEYALENLPMKEKFRELKNQVGNIMDPIADMFTRIRNGYAIRAVLVLVPYSKLKMEIAKLLQSGGYVSDVLRRGRKTKKSIEIVLAYNKENPVIKKIIRVSKPSRRVYLSLREMFPLSRGYGRRIMSTPRGILFDKDARKEKVGGEVIGEIW